MQETTQSSYDQVPYPSLPLRQTHPDQMASVAALFGLRTPPVDSCRVLEIGCADGANLIPMAWSLPRSQFVGIDLSSTQIEQGNTMARKLDLQNLTLRHQNILDFGDDQGLFDYIIVYGVWSWVPRQVQEKIFDICRGHLSPQGVAFISYNTYPGWHMRGAMRDMLLYHTRQFPDVQTRIGQARAILKFVSDSVPRVTGKLKENQAYAYILESEQERMVKQSNSYLLHEHLEEYNEPIYFYQFIERAEQHRLQYLAEVELSTMMSGTLPAEVAQTVGRLGSSVVATEQYLDFLRNRMFRQTLLCHADVVLERTWGVDLLERFYIASPLKPVSEAPSIDSAINEKFRGPTGTVVSSANPLNKAAMLYLAQIWPNAVTYEQLLREARKRAQSSASEDSDARMLGDTILKSLSVDLVELHINPPRFVNEVGECPVASDVSRLQASTEERVTNQRHEAIEIDGFKRAILPYLDGRHNRSELLQVVTELAPDGADDGATPSELLESELRAIAREALLVA